jgi:hypothetical protein
MAERVIRVCANLYLHFFWGIILIFLGLGVFSTRYVANFRKYHVLLGRFWFYGMIVQIYTSLWSRDNGFPWFVFLFGVICYGSLIIGHSLIRMYQTLPSINDESVPLAKDSITPSAGSTTGVKPNQTVEFFWWEIPRRRLVNAHAFFMSLSYVMLFGAGSAFTIRFARVASCQDQLSPY